MSARREGPSESPPDRRCSAEPVPYPGARQSRDGKVRLDPAGRGTASKWIWPHLSAESEADAVVLPEAMLVVHSG